MLKTQVDKLQQAIQNKEQQTLELHYTLARYEKHVSKLDRLEGQYQRALTSYSN